MKTIYIVRHAKAYPKEMDSGDISRSLTEKGQRDAHYIGTRLRDKGILPDLIISSAANRAIETANILADEMQYSRAAIDVRLALYEIEFEELLHILSGIDDSYESVMFVGHNPPMSVMSDYLTRYGVGNLAPGAVFCCEFKIDSWMAISKYGGICKFVLSP